MVAAVFDDQPDQQQPDQPLYHDAFYRFVPIHDPAALVVQLQAVCATAGVLGSILVASEGINGMLCGTDAQLSLVRAGFEADSRFQALFYKRTVCSQQVFARLKVKEKPEIVPLGIAGVDASLPHDRDLSPAQWQALLGRDDVVLLDNRNSFEYNLGHFRGAIDPGVENFRDFAAYIEGQLPQWQDKTIAMYCTGGIRCEKTSAWLAERGLRVLQLEGGILHYFQSIENASQDYQGTCFVFDQRRELDTQGREVAKKVVQKPD
jgi:UPF0176 protein